MSKFCDNNDLQLMSQSIVKVLELNLFTCSRHNHNLLPLSVLYKRL